MFIDHPITSGAADNDYLIDGFVSISLPPGSYDNNLPIWGLAKL
jgi:hypothetical protein